MSPAFGPVERLLKVADVAQALGLSHATVYKLAESGELPTIRIGNAIRCRAEDLAAFTRSRRSSP